MRLIETAVYTINEMNDTQRQAAYERYLQTGDVFFDAESTIEDMSSIGKCFGIDIENVFYSGFSSQGDGACFAGTYSLNAFWKADLTHYLGAECEYNTQYFDLGRRLQKINETYGDFSVSVVHSGHYYHEMCTRFWFDIEPQYDEDDNEISVDEVALEEDVKTELRDFMCMIYKALEIEYDYATSYDCFIENAEINVWEFTEDGVMV